LLRAGIICIRNSAAHFKIQENLVSVRHRALASSGSRRHARPLYGKAVVQGGGPLAQRHTQTKDPADPLQAPAKLDAKACRCHHCYKSQLRNGVSTPGTLQKKSDGHPNWNRASTRQRKRKRIADRQDLGRKKKGSLFAGATGILQRVRTVDRCSELPRRQLCSTHRRYRTASETAAKSHQHQGSQRKSNLAG